MPVASPIAASHRTNPILFAWELERRRRRQRFFARRANAWLVASVATLGGISAVAAWQQLRVHGARLLAPLLAHPGTAVVVAALAGATMVVHVRNRAEHRLATSWLASAPIARHAVLAALRWRVAFGVTPAFVAVAGLVASAGFASGTGAVSLVAALGAGFGAGALIGWRRGVGAAHAAPSPLPRLRRTRAGVSVAVNLDALARWPFAQLRATVNPRLHAWICGIALLTMPLGIPPVVAILILLCITAALALAALLRALLTTIADAAAWLRSTPLGLAAFAAAVCRRALAMQCGGAIFAALLLHALGSPAAAAVLYASAWLAWCLTAIGVALARRHSAHVHVELLALGVLLLAVASVAPPALPIAFAVVWAWQWRRMLGA